MAQNNNWTVSPSGEAVADPPPPFQTLQRPFQTFIRRQHIATVLLVVLVDAGDSAQRGGIARQLSAHALKFSMPRITVPIVRANLTRPEMHRNTSDAQTVSRSRLLRDSYRSVVILFHPVLLRRANVRALTLEVFAGHFLRFF